jgi:hypothetical protein
MTETYTVFAKRASDGGISYFHGGPNRECPCDLGGAVAFVASFRSCYSDSYEPFAWIGGSRADHAAHSEVLAANSIAAGRTIELVDGKYVPRGVPVEDKPAENLGELLRRALNPGPSHSTPATQAKQDEPSKTPLFDHLRRLRESGQGPAAVEAPRPPLPWADSKRVDRWEGYVVEEACIPGAGHHTYITHSHPLQRIAQEGDQLHGSAFLRKG